MVRMTALLVLALVLAFAAPGRGQDDPCPQGPVDPGRGRSRQAGRPDPCRAGHLPRGGQALPGGIGADLCRRDPEERDQADRACRARGIRSSCVRATDRTPGIEVARESRSGDCLADASQRLHGSLIRGITVRGFDDFGVFLLCVDHWRITRVRAIDNGEYGTFPSHTTIGRLDHSFASGVERHRPLHRAVLARAGGPQRREGQRERLRAREQLAHPRRPQPGERQHRRHPVVHAAEPRREVELRQPDRPQPRVQEQQEEHVRRPRGHGLRRAARAPES